jgi:hypothetical protein
MLWCMVFDGDRGKMTSKQWRSLPALSLRWVVMSSGGSGMARSGLDGGGELFWRSSDLQTRSRGFAAKFT